MIKVILFDFSRVFLFPKDTQYSGSLNLRHRLLHLKAKFKFFEHFKLNEDLIQFLSHLKGKYDMYVLTSGLLHRSPEVQVRLAPYIIDYYECGMLNLDKASPTAYQFMIRELKVDPQEIVFIDDKQVNVDAAKEAGLHALKFNDTWQAISELKQVIGI